MSAAVLSLTAAQASGLQGHVTDALTHSALPGAEVSVEGTDITAQTDSSGIFTFQNLKPGHYTIDIDYVGYPKLRKTLDVGQTGATRADFAMRNAENVETVVVTGQQRAQRIALQTKKMAGNFLDALAANDVGKLPDQNVAEAVRHMPSVSVADDQGEGRYVIIRGVSPDLANVTMNGATEPAPESDTREVKLDDIPSSLISALEVVKSLTPDMDANAIAGTVNIKTLSAFDRDTPFVFGRLSAGYYQMNSKSPVEGDITAGTRFGTNDQFGLVLSLNYSRRNIESENFGSGGPDWDRYNGYTVPSLMQLRDYHLIRKRTGIVANFDWRPTAETKFYIRTTYSTYSDHETRDRFTLTLPDDEDDYSNQTSSSGDFSGASAKRYVRNRTEGDHTLDVAAGGETRLGPGILSFEGDYGRAVEDEPRDNEYTFKAKKITGSYDLSSFLYKVTADDTAYDASDYAINSIKHETKYSAENLYQGRGDYMLPLNIFSADDEIKFGVKYTGRHKSHNESVVELTPTDDATLTLADVEKSGKSSIYGGRYTFGPRVDYEAAEAYVKENHGDFVCDDNTDGGLECDTESSVSDSLTSDYDVQESITAGYVMATVHIDNLTLIPGLRIEATDGTYKGKSYTEDSDFGEGFDRVEHNSYVKLFPGVNAKYDVSDQLNLRAAITTAIGRPNYADLSPYMTVDTSGSVPEVEEGNSKLKPLTATNYDMALEYYLPHQGILSIGGFYKDISDPIYTATLTNQSGTFGSYTLTGAKVTQPLNATSAKIRGLELEAQMSFDFLPSPFDGFGVDANYSYIDSSASGLQSRGDHVPMFDQSKNIAGLQLLYEKYGMAARLAYSYRSKYLDTVGDDKATDIYTAPHGQLDARLSWQLFRELTVFVEGKNLTNAPWRRFIGTSSQEYENERYGWSMNGGIQFQF